MLELIISSSSLTVYAHFFKVTKTVHSIITPKYTIMITKKEIRKHGEPQHHTYPEFMEDFGSIF